MSMDYVQAKQITQAKKNSSSYAMDIFYVCQKKFFVMIMPDYDQWSAHPQKAQYLFCI